MTATIPLGHVAGTMAFGFDALWVSAPGDDLLLRIDPATDAVDEWASAVEGAGCVVIGDHALWVSLLSEHGTSAGPDDPTVVRIDPADGAVTAEVATGGSLEVTGCMAATPEAIWVRATIRSWYGSIQRRVTSSSRSTCLGAPVTWPWPSARSGRPPSTARSSASIPSREPGYPAGAATATRAGRMALSVRIVRTMPHPIPSSVIAPIASPMSGASTTSRK